jgi:dihydrofolate reductase
MIKYKIIVALCKNYGIGFNNELPWRIPSDLKRFMKLTLDGNKNAVVMGKNTWESLPKKPLKGRDNLILSSTIEINNETSKGITKSFKSIEDIHSFCLEKKYDSVWVIGGETVYKEYLIKNMISEIYLTYIDKDFKCDRFFYMIPYEFVKVSSETSIENNLNIEYQVFQNKRQTNYKLIEMNFKKTLEYSIEKYLQGEYNIINKKKEKGYFFQTSNNEAKYIRDLTLDINFSLKKIVDLICNKILNLNSVLNIDYSLKVEKDKWTAIYSSLFPIKASITLVFEKKDEKTIVYFYGKCYAPEEYYNENFINMGKMLRPFIVDNYVGLLEKYF